jgi:hypothetical protein
VTVIEPGGYATGASAGAVQAPPNPLYDAARRAHAAYAQARDVGDPVAAGQAMLELADTADPPLRVFFGTESLPMLQQAYADRLKTWTGWHDLSIKAQRLRTVGPLGEQQGAEVPTRGSGAPPGDGAAFLAGRGV